MRKTYLRTAAEQCQSGNATFPQIEEQLGAMRKLLAPKQFTILLIDNWKLSDTRSRNAKAILITSNKQLAATRNRATDPDYSIIKDANLAQNLVEMVKHALAIHSG